MDMNPTEKNQDKDDQDMNAINRCTSEINCRYFGFQRRIYTDLE